MKQPPGKLTRLLHEATRVGSRPGDATARRLRKALLVGGSLVVLPLAVIWGGLYTLFDEPIVGLITLGYASFILLLILNLAATGDERPLTIGQLLCTLLLPFVLTLVLGGFWNASGIILAALMAPLGALLYADFRHASRWFVAYAILAVIAGFLNESVQRPSNLPAGLVTALFVLNVVVVSGLAFYMLRNFISQKESVLALLSLEREKSEKLLLNVLPRKIAERLKNETNTIADRFDSASILFADIVHFTELSARMDPVAMVDLLNEVFSHFDMLVEKCDLEKIRTIGDNYMIVAGAPRPRPDHAQVLAQVALEMLDYVLLSLPANSQQLQFRIGINSGPIVGGVIGRQKFHYDVWGDPVNVASRMESQGVPGKIQITRATYELIKDEFVCERRGTIAVKGKGEMETWFVIGREPDQSDGSASVISRGKSGSAVTTSQPG